MTAHFVSSPPPKDNDLDFTLLERYWLGETSSEESVVVERWFQDNPQWRGRYNQLRHEIRADRWADLSASDVSRRIAKTFERAGVQEPFSAQETSLALGVGTSRERSARVSSRRITTPNALSQDVLSQNALSRLSVIFGRSVRTIALGALGAGLLFIGWQAGTSRVNTHMATYKSTYATPNGQRANVTLPDGSEVILNAGSRLEVPSDFAANKRTIELTGEALFTVKHHQGAPFTVIAGPSTTRVLGTRFVVRHYLTDPVATVAVQEGKVSVDTVVLSARDQVQVGADGKFARQQVMPEQFSFADGRLVINDVPFKRAIPDLDRWYDVDIRLGDPALESIRLTLESTGGSVMDLQRILEVTLSLRVERTGRVLTLFPK